MQCVARHKPDDSEFTLSVHASGQVSASSMTNLVRMVLSSRQDADSSMACASSDRGERKHCPVSSLWASHQWPHLLEDSLKTVTVCGVVPFLFTVLLQSQQ